ncbi:microspherule protein 1-like isoform X1 [Histomonas meleagridis]|uniref:microspherule protein 1-like isoform X1 n=1 Tax=Histomonas meleagridis TaxID=135588 RepID=UPI003559EEA6|nr:microspherule protein 1-like isoform X1 [Histomonas meleagridis]KAH0801657.1 microspherule protein 1-like isoform X1 [Histomonas meleagridis]
MAEEETTAPTEETQENTSRPFVPPLAPPEIIIPINFDNESKKSLIISAMSVPFDYLQVSMSPLYKYSKGELRSFWLQYLHTPPEILFEPDNIPTVPFTQDEDFALLTYIRNENEISFPDFMNKFGFVFKPCRSMKSIIDRLNEIRNLDPSEFLNEYVQKVTNEYKFHLSTVNTKNASFYGHNRCIPNNVNIEYEKEKVDAEINMLESNLQIFSSSMKDCLAILRGENFEYRMCRESVMIGRGTADFDVDVDLTSAGLTSCTHVSRNQALLSFMDDFNFYLENIGNRQFRVNGKLIPCGCSCILKPGAILDFMDALLIFIPNMKFISDLKTACENAGTQNKIKK